MRSARIEFEREALPEHRPAPDWPRRIHLSVFAAFLVMYALVWIRLRLTGQPFAGPQWPEGLLLILTAATLLASTARHLPLQNVALASAIIGVLGSAATVLGEAIAIPLGSFPYSKEVGPRLIRGPAWTVPLIWVVLTLSSRGVARLALKPWREKSNWGLWVLGLTAVLAAWLNTGIQYVATFLWSGNHPRGLPALVISFVVAALASLVITALATPTLISKKHVTPAPPDAHPLIVWLLLNLLLASA